MLHSLITKPNGGLQNRKCQLYVYITVHVTVQTIQDLVQKFWNAQTLKRQEFFSLFFNIKIKVSCMLENDPWVKIFQSRTSSCMDFQGPWPLPPPLLQENYFKNAFCQGGVWIFSGIVQCNLFSKINCKLLLNNIFICHNIEIVEVVWLL